MAEKTKIELGAVLIQSAAVVIGIVFGVHEFILKDRDHDRQLLDLTMKQIERLRSPEVILAQKRLQELKDLAYGTPVANRSKSAKDPVVEAENKMAFAVVGRFDTETRDLAHFYSSIYNCVKINYCKKELVQALVCEDARRDLDLISELQGRVGNKLFTPTYFKPLVELHSVCAGGKPPQIRFP